MNTREMMRDISSDISREISFQDGLRPTWSIDLTKGVGGLNFSRASGGTCFDAAGNLVILGSSVPRVDYHPVTHAPLGLLVEEPRTNYLLNSMVPVTQSISLSTGTYVAWLVGSGSCAVAAGTAVGSGFGTITEANAVLFTLTTAGTVSFTVSGSVSRFQCENGNFPSSFIVTTTATATRAQDICGSSSSIFGGFNPLEGTFLVEATMAGVKSGAATPVLMGIDDGNDTNRLQLRTSNAGDYQVRMAVNNFNMPFISVAGWTPGMKRKLAVAYKSGDSNCAFAGAVSAALTAVFTDLGGFVNFHVGAGRVNTGPFNGWISSVSYYNSRLSNTLLGQLTA